MKHFIYKTTHKNGKYYIGRHSTENLNDGYIGSGRWPSSIKDKATLSREILEYANDHQSLLELEVKYLAEHFGKQNCMNKTLSSVGFAKGDPNHPNKDGRNAKTAYENGKHIWLSNNPSIRRSKEGIHQWQNGNSPNKDNKLNNKRIEEGTHNWLGSEENNRRIEAGTHNLLGSTQNEKMLAEGNHPSQKKKTCECCGKTVSIGMYVRWHGEKCKV